MFRFIAKKYVGKLGVQFAREKQKMLDSQILKDSSASTSNETIIYGREDRISEIQKADSDLLSEMEISEFGITDSLSVCSPSKQTGETKSEDMKKRGNDSLTTEDNTNACKKVKVVSFEIAKTYKM